MTRTFRKRTKDTSGRRVVPTSKARPGYKHKHHDGPLCSFCDRVATDELPTGKGWDAPVCDGDWCRAELREVRRGARSRAAPMTGEAL